MAEVTVSELVPTAAEYIELRAKMGWGRIDEEIAVKTIQAAAFTACGMTFCPRPRGLSGCVTTPMT